MVHWSQRWERSVLFAALALVVASGVAMASAAATINPALAYRHWAWTVVGVAACLAVSTTNYMRWTDAATGLYVVSLLALIVVEVAGVARLGAARWLSIFGLSIQPSELAKLSTVLLLARHLAGQPAPLPAGVVWTSMLLVAPPALLIFIQPDLGSATILWAIWLGMIFIAGASRRLLLGVAGAALALAPLGWHFLKDYQRDRLLVFMNPHIDPLGAGYTIIQSTIAIGSGGLTGRGWFSGTQNQLSFLPERHSDFIFSVIGEEWGLAGCLLVAALFIVLLSRMLAVALRASEPQGRLCAAGIASWIGYQAFVNMGMVMGVLPVVGVPLPLVSYGGSSMVMIWLALGLIHSVQARELLP